MNRLREMLLRHEGLRLKPYRDTVGKLTIGCGRNLDDVGITKEEALALLAHDLDRAIREAIDNFSWFKSLNKPRQDVVLNMLFNLGLHRFCGFKRMIAALSAQNYEVAAIEMLDSLWAKQVGLRAIELAQIMRTGIYPPGI